VNELKIPKMLERGALSGLMFSGLFLAMSYLRESTFTQPDFLQSLSSIALIIGFGLIVGFFIGGLFPITSWLTDYPSSWDPIESYKILFLLVAVLDLIATVMFIYAGLFIYEGKLLQISPYFVVTGIMSFTLFSVSKNWAIMGQ